MGQGKANLVRNALNDRIRDQAKDFADKSIAALGDNKPVEGNLEFRIWNKREEK